MLISQQILTQGSLIPNTITCIRTDIIMVQVVQVVQLIGTTLARQCPTRKRKSQVKIHIITNPSPPTRPRPDILKKTSISQNSFVLAVFVNKPPEAKYWVENLFIAMQIIL